MTTADIGSRQNAIKERHFIDVAIEEIIARGFRPSRTDPQRPGRILLVGGRERSHKLAINKKRQTLSGGVVGTD